MARAIKRTAEADGTYTYFESVNTPDYPTGTWLIDPDLSGVSAVPQQYWKVVADTVVEMTQGEKDAVDYAHLNEQVRCIELSFAGHKFPYAETSRTTYTTVARFIFQGSKRVGSIDKIHVAINVGSGVSASMRVYDSTNGAILGETTGITNEDLQVLLISPISNVPELTSILELQVKVDADGNEAKIHALTIDFA